MLLLLLDALLLGTVGVINRSPWLLGGAGLAAALTLLVIRFGKAFDRRRAEIAASRAELRGEAGELANAARRLDDQ